MGEPEPEPDEAVEPENHDKSHTALHDPRNVELRLVEGPRRFYGYTREDAYRVLAGLPPRGTVNIPLVDLNDPDKTAADYPAPPESQVPGDQLPPGVPVIRETLSEEDARLFAGLYAPKEWPKPEADADDRDDEA